MIEDRFPERGSFDTAVSRALLEAVARREQPETLRLYVPGDVLAFSIADRTRPGFGRAVEAARDAGFEPVLRLAGGAAAVFHGGTLAFAWTLPIEDYRAGIHARFDEGAGRIAGGLRRLGVDARVGEVPGEYCPGSHSINARGRVKIVGIGQRVIRGAAHVGGVIVVRDPERIRGVLAPIYGELGLEFAAETVGCIADESGNASLGEVRGAILAEFGEHRECAPASLPAELLTRAESGEARHRIGSPLRPAGPGELIGSKSVGEPGGDHL